MHSLQPMLRQNGIRARGEGAKGEMKQLQRFIERGLVILVNHIDLMQSGGKIGQLY